LRLPNINLPWNLFQKKPTAKTAQPKPTLTPLRPVPLPLPVPDVLAQPLALLQQPFPRGRPKDCVCDEEKKKEKKKRKPRSECWKGSYIETATGTKKHRREQVTC